MHKKSQSSQSQSVMTPLSSKGFKTRSTQEDPRELLLQQCKITIDDLKDELQQLEITRNSLASRLDLLSSAYNQQSQLLEQERARTHALQDELNHLSEAMNTQVNASIELKGGLAQHQKKLIEQEMYTNALRQKIAIQESIITTYNNELGNKEQECSTLRSSHNQQDSSVFTQLVHLKQSFTLQSQKLKEVTQEVESLRAANAQLTSRIENLQEQNRIDREREREQRERDAFDRRNQIHHPSHFFKPSLTNMGPLTAIDPQQLATDRASNLELKLELMRIKDESVTSYKKMKQLLKQQQEHQQQKQAQKSHEIIEIPDGSENSHPNHPPKNEIQLKKQQLEAAESQQRIAILEKMLTQKESEIIQARTHITQQDAFLETVRDIIVQKKPLTSFEQRIGQKENLQPQNSARNTSAKKKDRLLTPRQQSQSQLQLQPSLNNSANKPTQQPQATKKLARTKSSNRFVEDHQQSQLNSSQRSTRNLKKQKSSDQFGNTLSQSQYQYNQGSSSNIVRPPGGTTTTGMQIPKDERDRNHQKLLDMKRKMMQLEIAVRQKDLQNSILKEGIEQQKHSTNLFNHVQTSRQNRAISNHH